MKSQNTRILAHLRAGNSITPRSALFEFDCFRLAARIFDLRAAGNDIIAQRVERDDKSFARYTLIGGTNNG